MSITKQTTPHFIVEHVSDLAIWRRGKPGEIIKIQTENVGEDPWEFVSFATRQIFERIRTAHPTTLEQVADIFVGLQTSSNKVYIIDPCNEINDNVSFVDYQKTNWTIEKVILRPCLKKVSLPAFSHPQSNAYIIFPYKIKDDLAQLFTPTEMQENFPACWAYLNAHKATLKQRSIQGKTPETWYRYGRSQSLTKFNGDPKLIWSVLSREARYAYDDRNILFTGGGNGPYYGLRPSTSLSIYYLLAILSHPLIDAMVRSRASAFQGDYKSHGKQFIKDIPIRQIDLTNDYEKATHNRIVDLVEKLIQVTERTTTATIPVQGQQAASHGQRLRQAVEDQVGELYGITDTDMVSVGLGG